MAIDFAKLVLGPCVSTFGEPATYYALASDPSGGTYPVRGIFDAQHEIIREIDGVPHSTQAPVLTVREIDLPVVPQQGDEVQVRGQRYRVTDPQPCGQGRVDMILREKV